MDVPSAGTIPLQLRECFSRSPASVRTLRDRPSLNRLGVFAILFLAASLSGCAAATSRGAQFPRGYPIGYHEQGMASWYGPGFDGRRTANGERFDRRQLTAAHRTLPFGSMVQVRSLTNDRVVVVRINDRGPFTRGRILDLSYAAAMQLGMIGQGTHRVELKLIAYHAASDDGGGLSIQVALFGDRPPAYELIVKLKRSYPQVRLIEVDLPVGTGYRVHVGPFTTEQEASAVAEQINRQFQVESLVMREKIS
jgi:rare lipoprotein A